MLGHEHTDTEKTLCRHMHEGEMAASGPAHVEPFGLPEYEMESAAKRAEKNMGRPAAYAPTTRAELATRARQVPHAPAVDSSLESSRPGSCRGQVAVNMADTRDDGCAGRAAYASVRAPDVHARDPQVSSFEHAHEARELSTPGSCHEAKELSMQIPAAAAAAAAPAPPPLVAAAAAPTPLAAAADAPQLLTIYMVQALLQAGSLVAATRAATSAAATG